MAKDGVLFLAFVYLPFVVWSAEQTIPQGITRSSPERVLHHSTDNLITSRFSIHDSIEDGVRKWQSENIAQAHLYVGMNLIRGLPRERPVSPDTTAEYLASDQRLTY